MVEEGSPHPEALGVVDVEQAADGAGEGRLVGGRGAAGAWPACAAELGPAAVAAGVELGEVDVGLGEEAAQGDGAGEAAEVFDQGAPAGAEGLFDVVEDGLLRLALEVDGAARRQAREALLDLAQDLLAGAAEDGAEAAVEAELGVHVADEVEGGEALLAL